MKPGLWVAAECSPKNYPGDAHACFASVEENSFWFRHRNAVIGTVLDRFPPRGPVADVGGGNGFVALGLKQGGYDVIVVEPSESGARTAHSRELPVIQAEFTANLFHQSSLPAIGLFDVIEHIPNDGAFLRDARAVLAPNGLLYLTAPALQFLWSSDDEYAHHCRRYAPQQLSNLLTKNGFEVLALSFFFSLLVPLVFGLRTLPSLLGWRRITAPEEAVRDHKQKVSLTWLTERAFSFEPYLISRGRSLAIGTSVIAVARKVVGN
jgi:SAM-dependent methyltransferase